MKPILLVLLIVSVAANALLLLNSQPGLPPVAPAAATRPILPPEPRVVLDDAVWQRAVTGDISALQTIQRAGLPPQLSRALLQAALQEQYREREKALYPSAGDLKYWEGNYNRALYTPKDRVALIDLRREQEALLDRWTPGWREDEAPEDPNTTFLSADKARQAKLVEEDFNALMGNIRGASVTGFSGIMLPTDREKLGYLEKERHAELARLLTPQELEEYDLRNSPTAASLRYELAAFDATEQEFRGIFQIQKTAVDSKYPAAFDVLTADQRTARAKAQEEAKVEIKALLGEERFAAYTRAQDRDYRAFAAITERLQLPNDRAVEAYRLKTSLEEKFKTGSESAPRKERNELIAALAQEADREFTRILGAKGYEVYKQYGELPRRVNMYLNAAKPPPKS